MSAQKTPPKKRARTDTTPKPKAPSRRLPPALVANARALHARGVARLKAQGEAALERIRDKLGDLAENIFEIGEALVALSTDGVAKAMGYADFEDLCRRAIALSPTTARRWMALATRLERSFVVKVGADRARALMELCDATPAEDAPEDLLGATLRLPSGRTLVVKTATTDALDDAAREFRRASAASGTTAELRGFTATPAEKRAHAALAKRLAKAPPHAHAATRLVAQRDADGAKLVIEVRLVAWRETLALLLGR